MNLPGYLWLHSLLKDGQANIKLLSMITNLMANSTNINWSSIGLTKNIYIQNTGRNDATYGVSVTGVVRQKLPESHEDLPFSKLLDLDGNELKSNSIQQGDAIIDNFPEA